MVKTGQKQDFQVAFTQLHFQHKKEHLVTVLAFHLHTNDENAYPKQRPLNSEP